MAPIPDISMSMFNADAKASGNSIDSAGVYQFGAVRGVAWHRLKAPTLVRLLQRLRQPQYAFFGRLHRQLVPIH